LNRAIQRTPDIDDAEASFEELFGFFGEMVMHALCGRLDGLIDMHSCYRCSRGIGSRAADGMVEDEDLVASFHMIENQFLDFGIVVFLDRLVVYEISLGRVGNVGDDLEGVSVERIFGFVSSDIVDWDLDVKSTKVPLWLALGWLLDVVKWNGSILRRLEIVQSNGGIAARDETAGIAICLVCSLSSGKL
jgi:hypothetical protein